MSINKIGNAFFEIGSWYHRTKILCDNGTTTYGKLGGFNTPEEAEVSYKKHDEEYQKFINLIKDRSNFKFDTEVTTQDKILTLSTCLDNNRRLVVHAVLQKDTKNQEIEETKNIEEQNIQNAAN